MSKKNEVVAQASTEVAVSAESSGTFGSQISAEDIILPKILLMQSISELVEDDTNAAKSGDFVHSLDEVVVGSKANNPVEFIALGMYKTIQTFEDNKYVKTESWSPELAQLAYEETLGGKVVNRNTVMNYYVIRPSDIESMQVFPFVISFKRTSLKGGKKLATKLMMLEEFGAEMYAKTFKLVAKQEEGDKGKYYVMDIVDGRKSNEVEIKQAIKWTSRLAASEVKVHESDEADAAVKAAPAAGDSTINF